jgi:simple sugar transport system substrate-binding protein
MKKLNRRQAVGMIAAATGSMLHTPALAQARPKVAFTLLFDEGGTVGWDYEHVRGVEQARAAFGDRVQIDTFHNVAEWGQGDAEMFRKLVADGYDMIFTTSAGYMQSTIEVAYEAPNVLFESCAGFIRAKNVSTYNIRWYEARVAQGFLAATLSKSNRVGYLGAYPIPQVVRGINSAYLAAKSINPDIQFDIVWLNTWFDAERETQVAHDLIDRGADVLMQHTVSTEPVKVAQERGVYAFGQGSDMAQYAPDAVLTSSINNWGPYYVRRISEFLDGTWETQDTWGGLAENMLSIGDILDTLPNRVHLQSQDLISRIRSGEQHSFSGPVRRQDGSGWLAPGENADDSSLLTMNYYVDGINSVFPTNQ